MITTTMARQLDNDVHLLQCFCDFCSTFRNLFKLTDNVQFFSYIHNEKLTNNNSYKGKLIGVLIDAF